MGVGFVIDLVNSTRSPMIHLVNGGHKFGEWSDTVRIYSIK